MDLFHSRGFTLTEMLVAVSTLGVLAAAAQPSVQAILDSRRLAGAADALSTTLEFARYESIKQMRPMVVSYVMSGTSTWQAGLRDTDECNPAITDPNDPEACSVPVGEERVRKVVDHGTYPSVSARANRPFTRFEPLRATAVGTNVTVTFSTASGKEVRVIVAPIGRIRSCSPDGPSHVIGFPEC